MRAFMKKEWMEWSRTGRLLVLVLVFAVLGILNPALARLTPWMMEILSESLAETGVSVTDVTVDAMVSWTQFYKNIPMGLIVFVLLCSGSFTSEYQKGTLIPAVTKGLPRRKILLAKSAMMAAVWTGLYILCAGITYAYNAYFWDNGIADHLLLALFLTWLLGLWVTGLVIFFSAVSRSGSQVLLGTGAVVLGMYLLGLFPKFSMYLPIRLLDGMVLLQGAGVPGDYYASMAAAAILIVLTNVLGVFCFNRKAL